MNSVATVFKYFPELTAGQKHQFTILEKIYSDWNEKINLISRKDFGNFYEHHVLHSLSIANVMNFCSGARLLDAGTGGGFPGIPLAILFPASRFHLVDSVGKKIIAVRSIIDEMNLQNVTAENTRIETIREKFNFVLGRAVCKFDIFVEAVRSKILPEPEENHPYKKNELPNGIFYLKGEDIINEKDTVKAQEIKLYVVSEWFKEKYFTGKYVIYLKP